MTGRHAVIGLLRADRRQAAGAFVACVVHAVAAVTLGWRRAVCPRP
ncbi:hypothetical protein ACFQHV_01365 [Promicromonospora thailandica]|nr:hypothetical protein [Promicromonospora thailandica]